MTFFPRRFPRSSAALLVAGTGAVFLAAAAPASHPEPAMPVAQGPVLAAPAAQPALPATTMPASSMPLPIAPAMPPTATHGPTATNAPTPVAPMPASVQPAAPLPKELSVTIDQTRTLELDKSVSTVSVGNPAIADVSLQSNRLFLIGKTFGRTNVVALNANGETVLDMMVFVTSTGGGSVTVYKGNRQVTYNCAPNCDRALMPGDSKDDFDMISGQNSTKTGFGTGSRE